MNKFLLVLLAAFIFCSINAKAEVYDRSEFIISDTWPKRLPPEEDAEKFMMDKNVEITLVESGELKTAMWKDLSKNDIPEGYAVNAGTKSIVNIADKAWIVARNNAPKPGNKSKYATALPPGTTDFNLLTNWNKAMFKKYAYSYKNLLGMNVVEFTVMVRYTAGGSYKGKGKYLTDVGFEILGHQMSWGWNLSLDVQVDDSAIVNIGSQTNPIAQMTLVASYRIGTPMGSNIITDTFIINGDGGFEYVGVK